MPRSSSRRLAAVLLAAALTAACSSSVAGSAVTGAAPPSAAVSSSAPSSSAPSSSALSSSAAPSPSPSSAPSAPPATPDNTSDNASDNSDGSDGTIGDVGIGDPYYPTSGNGGYQIDSYDIDLRYEPDTNDLQSTAQLDGTVLSDDGLTQFNFDLQPTLTVTDVTVNDAPAAFEQDNAELVVTPAELVASGAPLAITVTYGGNPGLISGGTSGLSDGGWYRTASGGAVVTGEPFSASAWYPVNEHPADTASFAVTATVPSGWKVMSNGVQQTDLPEPPAGQDTYRWELSEPVASYLTTIYIDDFTVVTGTLRDGRPVVSAIAPDANPDATDLANSTSQVVDLLSTYFGPYPYQAAGGIFTGLDTGFALETASRPMYGGGRIASFETVVHELAHQWYGNDVTVQRWSDICLNECFASYAPWLWAADVENQDLDEQWKQQMASVSGQPDFWRSPLVDMGPGEEFTRVYDRGPLALHALRNEIGDDAFRTLLKQWPATYGGKNATFENLETMVNSLAGRDVTPFMDAWFRGTTVPAQEFRYPGDLGN